MVKWSETQRERDWETVNEENWQLYVHRTHINIFHLNEYSQDSGLNVEDC